MFNLGSKKDERRLFPFSYFHLMLKKDTGIRREYAKYFQEQFEK